MAKHDHINQLTARLFRENSGKMVAVLSHLFGLKQIDRINDIVQDTFEKALIKWTSNELPENPSAWLMQVAKNTAINTFKRDSKMLAFSPSIYLKHFEKGFENEFNLLLSPKEIKDSQLRLLFTCCHPNVSEKNQIIITLNILCGFGVPEIANALMMKEEAVKKALVRSKAALRELDNILQTRIVTKLEERLKTVRTVIYLMFNEGYKTTRGLNGIDNDLCYEAIRLGKLLNHDDNETNALISLMFFNLSRFPARINDNFEWLTLAEQDRSLWNSVFIEEGYYYLRQAINSETLTRFHIEAIIASVHCSAPSFEETDWHKIVYLYNQLTLLEPHSTIITINRIIAESHLSSKQSIQKLEELEVDMDSKMSFLVHAAKADIHKRRGELKKAKTAYLEALNLSVSPIDKKFLESKILQIQISKN